MGLKYHQPTFDLLKQEPVMFPLASTWLENLENEIGHHLAPSVREWYSIEGCHDILAEHSNQDHPIPLRNLGAGRKIEAAVEPDSLQSVTLLEIMIENQGVCTWAVKLDDSDDPPVFVSFDDEDSPWQLAANHFSDFIYSWVWDWSFASFSYLQIARPLTREDLAYLRLHFDEHLTTSIWWECTEYRFSKQDQKVMIRDGAQQADWLISASSADSFYELGRTLCDGIKIAVWSGVAFGADDEDSVLDIVGRWRKEFYNKS